MIEGIIVSSRGLNGSTTYFALTAIKRAPLFSNLGLKKFSESIVKTYPEISKKISKYCEEGFIGEFPSEIDLSKLDSNPRIALIESISEQIKNSQK